MFTIRILTVLVWAALVLAQAAIAQVPKRVIGAGLDSCEAWTAARQADGVAARAAEQWVVGYLSGIGQWGKDVDPLHGLDAERVWAAIDTYCRLKPRDPIGEAATQLVFARGGKRP